MKGSLERPSHLQKIRPSITLCKPRLKAPYQEGLGKMHLVLALLLFPSCCNTTSGIECGGEGTLEEFFHLAWWVEAEQRAKEPFPSACRQPVLKAGLHEDR